MKKFIHLLFLLSSNLLIAQKINVTIIGTAHYFKEEYQHLQQFKTVQQDIIDINPDIICIEGIPTYDATSLKEILPNTLKRADHLRDSLKKVGAYPMINFERQNSNDTNSEFWKVYSANLRLVEGAILYADYDIWNAYYKWFQLQEKGDTLGYFSRFQKNHENSEFGLMVFPSAQKLGINKLHCIDFREGEDQFLAVNNQVLKKLLFHFKWKPLGIYLKAQKQYKKAEKAGELITYINSEAFQKSFSQMIDELPKQLPKSTEAKFVQSYWLQRNEVMANRVIETAIENNAENILLTVGSAHVLHIKRIIEEKGHHATTYNEWLKRRD